MPPSPPPSTYAIFTPCRRSHDARNGKSGSSYSSHPRSGSSRTSCPRGPYNYMPYERILPVCSAWKPPTNASAPGSRSANIFYSLVVALAQIPGKDACALSKNAAARGCPPAVRPNLLVIPLCLSFPFVCHSRRESAFSPPSATTGCPMIGTAPTRLSWGFSQYAPFVCSQRWIR